MRIKTADTYARVSECKGQAERAQADALALRPKKDVISCDKLRGGANIH